MVQGHNGQVGQESFDGGRYRDQHPEATGHSLIKRLQKSTDQFPTIRVFTEPVHKDYHGQIVVAF